MDDDKKRMVRGLVLFVVILAAAVAAYSLLTRQSPVEKTKADAAQARLEEMRKNQGDSAPVETRAEDTPPPSGPIRRGPAKAGP